MYVLAVSVSGKEAVREGCVDPVDFQVGESGLDEQGVPVLAEQEMYVGDVVDDVDMLEVSAIAS